MAAARRPQVPPVAFRIAARTLLCALPVAAVHAASAAPQDAVSRAREALAAGRSEEAIELFHQAAVAEGGVEAHRGLARALAGAGRVEEAVAGLGRFAETLLGAGRWAEAEVIAEEALALAPDSGADLARLGRARVLQEEFVGAEEPLRRALALGRHDPTTLLALATTLWENGRVEEAAGIYERALDATGRAPAVLHALGRLLAWAGRYEEALGPLEEARRGAPGDALLLVDLARALDGAGRSEEAVATYRRALDLAPEHWEARYRLGLLLVRAGEADAGREQLELHRRQRAEQQEEERLAGLERAALEEARWLLETGEVASALAVLEGLPEGPDVLLVLGLARLAAGDPKAAVAALRLAVALAPEREDLRSQLTAARLAAERP